MKATVQHFHIADDPDVGSALALFLAAAGYEVETDFVDGSTFISVDALDPEVCLPGAETLKIIARNLRERLGDLAEEIELAELSSEFRKVA